MQASDHDRNENNGPTPRAVSAQFKQLLAVILILGAVVILWAVFSIQREIAQQRIAKNWSIAEFGLATPYQNRLASNYTDQNKDLIADCPQDPQDRLNPETIVFSYIGGSREDQDRPLWEPLLQALAEKTARPVEHRQLPDVKAQLLELRSQALHVTALNTGATPAPLMFADSFPSMRMGTKGASNGISTEFIVPYSSPVQSIQDLKNKRITFTSENSNSGFKAPVVILNSDFGMRPGLEYHYGFSTSHEESIRLIKENAITVAPVASDMLQRALAAGEIMPNDYRVIYESELFPPAVFGCLYSLDPELQQKIREAFESCSLEGHCAWSSAWRRNSICAGRLQERLCPDPTDRRRTGNQTRDWRTTRIRRTAVRSLRVSEATPWKRMFERRSRAPRVSRRQSMSLSSSTRDFTSRSPHG